MSDDFFAQRRIEPAHSPASQLHAVENTLQTKGLQADTAAYDVVQLHSSPTEEFTISVEQVREHFKAKGLSKSKDTIQRWCRNGDLSCQKQGLLGRYFTTESSLLALEKKLLPDMIAENVGAVVPDELVQAHAGATAPATRNMPVYAGADTAAHTGMQLDEADQEPLHAGELSDLPLQPPTIEVRPDTGRLAAENEGLREQLENRDKQIEFLQEEIRSSREQRGAVVQISNRMLETLETMAIGGRLDRPRAQEDTPAQTSETVRFKTTEPNSSRV